MRSLAEAAGFFTPSTAGSRVTHAQFHTRADGKKLAHHQAVASTLHDLADREKPTDTVKLPNGTTIQLATDQPRRTSDGYIGSYRAVYVISKGGKSETATGSDEAANLAVIVDAPAIKLNEGVMEPLMAERLSEKKVNVSGYVSKGGRFVAPYTQIRTIVAQLGDGDSASLPDGITVKREKDGVQVSGGGGDPVKFLAQKSGVGDGELDKAAQVVVTRSANQKHPKSVGGEMAKKWDGNKQSPLPDPNYPMTVRSHGQNGVPIRPGRDGSRPIITNPSTKGDKWDRLRAMSTADLEKIVTNDGPDKGEALVVLAQDRGKGKAKDASDLARRTLKTRAEKVKGMPPLPDSPGSKGSSAGKSGRFHQGTTAKAEAAKAPGTTAATFKSADWNTKPAQSLTRVKDGGLFARNSSVYRIDGDKIVGIWGKDTGKTYPKSVMAGTVVPLVPWKDGEKPKAKSQGRGPASNEPGYGMGKTETESPAAAARKARSASTDKAVGNKLRNMAKDARSGDGKAPNSADLFRMSGAQLEAMAKGTGPAAAAAKKELARRRVKRASK